MSRVAGGIKPWLLQRFSAVYLLLFMPGMFFYIYSALPLDYAGWHALFRQTWLQLLWAFMFFMLIMHAWVGMRNIIIDYIGSLAARLFLYTCVLVFLGLMLTWSLQVIFTGNTA